MVDVYHDLIQPIDSNSDSAEVHLQMSIVYDLGSKLRTKTKNAPYQSSADWTPNLQVLNNKN